ncbi:NF-kappa-B inhibitor-interacting Ras-like protein 1 [Aplysia californica]|uniref:NF-kappa-B inhibitor-interacting Ras-like protein 1 n=1 Tax=Aplysia californica TaxID=6500 RepID=A0ABM0JTS2_APLCA|nr:NF-kappa-B inhibitor-interacting Ras-like protein 1 [Aplysia californica]
MGKTSKILLCGRSGVGKTAVLEQLLYGNHIVEAPTHSTLEDIYTAVIETDRGVKEKVRIFDVGMPEGKDTELPRHYLNFPDGFILVYDVTSFESFKLLDRLKKDMDKHKDKREGHIVVIGNKSELTERREVQFQTAMAWASKEKVRLWEVSVPNRKSLVEPFVWLTSKITQPTGKSNFLPGRKTKSSASGNLDTS